MKIQENISFLLSKSNNQCNETPKKLKKKQPEQKTRPTKTLKNPKTKQRVKALKGRNFSCKYLPFQNHLQASQTARMKRQSTVTQFIIERVQSLVVLFQSQQGLQFFNIYYLYASQKLAYPVFQEQQPFLKFIIIWQSLKNLCTHTNISYVTKHKT